MDISSDTIAAIATAPGEAGISIVRISGPRSMEIANCIFRAKDPPASKRSGNTFVHGYIHSPAQGNGDGHIDEVILLIYRAPRSYTREDVIEIQGHGGRTSAKRILRTVLQNGARLAEPGEFTKRAFLNGRIDLLQAEAVSDLIRAQSDRAASAAMEQLRGRLSRVFGEIYDSLLTVAADLEATLDFPEDDLPVTATSDIVARLGEVRSRCRDVLSTWDQGHLLREGALVVISGRPNVGKSTLLNCLLGMARAIVTDVAGTTRDTIEEQIVLDGIPIRLVDTAGLARAKSDIEREGVQRAKNSIKAADVVLYVIDCSRPLEREDINWLDETNLAKCVVVLNKTDLAQAINVERFSNVPVVCCSALRSKGIEEVQEAIVGRLALGSSYPPQAAISERHRQSLQNALNALNKAGALLSNGNEDCVVLAAADLRGAMAQLERISGRRYDQDLLNTVFSRFCIGK